tara:strand:- start:2247 stop:2534 length:288 start_codon:yes stop_codon:yes gene_type:complete
MYELDIKEKADKILKKLAKKNHKQFIIIYKKIEEIKLNPYHKYKNLRSPLQMFKRVHIDKHFVLIFLIKHDEKIVEIWNYNHHDKVYQWRPKLIE